MENGNPKRNSAGNDQENIPVYERLSKAKSTRPTGTQPSSSSPAKESDSPARSIRGTASKTNTPKSTTRSTVERNGKENGSAKAKTTAVTRTTPSTGASTPMGKTAAPKMSAVTLRRLADKTGSKDGAAPLKQNTVGSTRPSPHAASTSRASTASPSKSRTLPPSGTKATPSSAAIITASDSTMTRRLPAEQSTPKPAGDQGDAGSPSSNRGTPSPFQDDGHAAQPNTTVAEEWAEEADNKSNWNSARRLNSELEDKVRGLESMIHTQKNKLNTDIEARNAEIKRLQEKSSAAGLEIVTLQTRIHDLAKESARKGEVIDRLHQEVGELNGDIRDLGATKARNNALHQERNQLQNRLYDCKSQIQELERQVESIKQKEAEAWAERDTLVTANEALKADVVRLEHSIKTYGDTNDEQKKELELSKAKCNENQQAYDELRNIFEDVRRRAKESELALRDQFRGAKAELSQVKRDLSEAHLNKKELWEQINAAKNSNLEMQSKHMDEMDDLRNLLAERQNELDEALDAVDSKVMSDEAAREYLDDYRKILGLDKDGSQDLELHDAHHEIVDTVKGLIHERDTAISISDAFKKKDLQEGQVANNAHRQLMISCLEKLGDPLDDAPSASMGSLQGRLLNLVNEHALLVAKPSPFGFNAAFAPVESLTPGGSDCHERRPKHCDDPKCTGRFDPKSGEWRHYTPKSSIDRASKRTLETSDYDRIPLSPTSLVYQSPKLTLETSESHIDPLNLCNDPTCLVPALTCSLCDATCPAPTLGDNQNVKEAENVDLDEASNVALEKMAIRRADKGKMPIRLLPDWKPTKDDVSTFANTLDNIVGNASGEGSSRTAQPESFKGFESLMQPNDGLSDYQAPVSAGSDAMNGRPFEGAFGFSRTPAKDRMLCETAGLDVDRPETNKRRVLTDASMAKLGQQLREAAKIVAYIEQNTPNLDQPVGYIAKASTEKQ